MGVAGDRRRGSGGLGLEIHRTALLEPSRSVNKPWGVSGLACPLPAREPVSQVTLAGARLLRPAMCNERNVNIPSRLLYGYIFHMPVQRYMKFFPVFSQYLFNLPIFCTVTETCST